MTGENQKGSKGGQADTRLIAIKDIAACTCGRFYDITGIVDPFLVGVVKEMDDTGHFTENDIAETILALEAVPNEQEDKVLNPTLGVDKVELQRGYGQLRRTRTVDAVGIGYLDTETHLPLR
jgi:hypothetical protein